MGFETIKLSSILTNQWCLFIMEMNEEKQTSKRRSDGVL